MCKSVLKILLLLQLILLTSIQVDGKSLENSHPSQPDAQLINRNLLQTIRSYMDLKANPCENFYQYACGNWENVHDENANYIDSIGRLEYEFNKELTTILERVIERKSHNELYRKLKEHYLACKATESHYVEHHLNIVTPVYNSPEAPTAWPYLLYGHNKTWHINGFNWLLTLGKLRTFGMKNALIRADIKRYNSTDFIIVLGRPEKMYWTSHEFKHVWQLKRSKLSKEREMAGKLLEFQSRLYAIHNANKDHNEPQFTRLRWVVNGSELNLRGYLQQLLSNQIVFDDDIMLEVPNKQYLRELEPLMAKTDTQVVEYYIMLKLITHLAQELPKSNTPEHCVEFMRKQLPLAMDYLYEREVFAAKRNATDSLIYRILRQMQSKFQDIISEHSQHLTAEELEFLRLKVQHMRINIGTLPNVDLDADFFRDYYENLHAQRTDFIANFLSALQHSTERERILLQLHEPALEHTLYTVRYASPAFQETGNTLIIPYGYLREPIFDTHYHELFLFAELGNTLGHEMFHGFDKLGLKYDAWGDHSKIFAAAMERPEFVDAIKCLQLEATSNINEKIADFSGFRLAFEAHFKQSDVPHFDMEQTMTNKQLFFVKFAQFFCAISLDRINMPWSLPKYDTPFKRVPQTVANSKEFAKEFGCDRNTTMNPNFRCELW